MQGSTSSLSLFLIAVDHLSVFFNERYIQSLSMGVRWVDTHLSRTVGSSSKLFAWFIPPPLDHNRPTVGLAHFIIVRLLSTIYHGENKGGMCHRERWLHRNQIKTRAGWFFPSRYGKTFAATSCYSTQPYRQVPFNDRKRVKSIHTYRSVVSRDNFLPCIITF